MCSAGAAIPQMGEGLSVCLVASSGFVRSAVPSAASAGTPVRKDTPMLKMVAEESTGAEWSSTLDEICRERVRRMLEVALEVEVDEYLAAFALDAIRPQIATRGSSLPHAVTPRGRGSRACEQPALAGSRT
jgi:hypothetical protein